MKRDVLTKTTESNPICDFNSKDFYDYVLESFLKIQNIKTDDIYVENASDEATVKKVAMLKAFIDLHFAQESNEKTHIKSSYQISESILSNDDIVSKVELDKNNCPFVEYIIQKEKQIALSETTHKECSHTIFLQGNAGAGKSTLTQFICLWNWAIWLNNNNYNSATNDTVKSFLRENKYSAYSSEFENNQIFPVTFRLRLSDFGKFLYNIQNEEALVSFQTVVHFIAFTIWLHIKEVSIDTNAYMLWGNEILSANTLANKIYLFCANLINSNSKIIYLFDGLDEVKFAREDLIVNLKDFLMNNVKKKDSKNLAIVTSRVENARDLLEEKVAVENANNNSVNKKTLFDERCYLKLLDENDVEQCVKSFCCAKYDEDTSQNTYVAIMDSYRKKTNTRHLMKTPLEVTMVCLVYQGNREIPENDAKLYKSYIDMYYNREKERLKLNNSKYKDFYDHPCTKDTIYHILEWAGYQLELEELNAISWEQVIQEAKRYNTNEDGVLKYQALDSDYFNKIAEVVLTKLNLLNSTMDNLYEMDEVHKTVKEFLAALHITSLENENDFEKNIIKIILLEKNVVFDFVMWMLSSSPARERSFRNSVSLNFCNSEYKNIAQVCESINIGSKIASKLLNSRIYKGRTPEKAIVEKLATHVNIDAENEIATTNIISLLEKDNYYISSIIFGHIDKFIGDNNAITANLFRVLSKVIEKKIYVDKKFYPNIDRILNSDILGKNILKNAKKYKTEVTEELLSIILANGISIDVSENNEELLCSDLNRIKYIEALKYLLSTELGAIEDINLFLYKQLGSVFLSNDEKIIYSFPSENGVLSFKYSEYDSKKFLGGKISKKDYLTFVENIKGCGLLACAELLMCIRFFTYANMLKYVKLLSCDVYRKELLQIFGNECNTLSKDRFPALVITRRSFVRKDSAELVEVVKSSFPNKTKRLFNCLNEFEDALYLYKIKFPCAVICRNIDTVESWVDTLDYIKKYSFEKGDSASFEILAFVFSCYEWSCQHGTQKMRYDDIHEILKPYTKDIYELLFKHHESLLGDDYICLLHYIFSSRPSEYIEPLKELPTEKLYDSFPRYLSKQMDIELDKNESFLSGESYQAMLHFLNSFTFSGANQYWDFFVKTFLLIRNGKDFIVSFCFSSRPNEEEDSFKILYIIDLIKSWYKTLDREGIDKVTAIEIIKSIKMIENEDKSLLLELIINYLIYNFGESEDFRLSLLLIELLKQIEREKDNDFYSSRIKLYNYLEKHLKKQI